MSPPYMTIAIVARRLLFCRHLATLPHPLHRLRSTMPNNINRTAPDTNQYMTLTEPAIGTAFTDTVRSS